MCVKQFYGYTCGHCSIPTLIQCPLAASNPLFPTCSYPAERPIFTGTYCHPCFRVVWNIRVLKEEEEHRCRHLRGECFCEVRFEGEDRERHLRGRAANATSQDPIHTQEAEQESVQQGAVAGTAGKTPTIQEASLAFAQQWQTHSFLQENHNIGYLHQDEGAQMTDPNQSYAIAVGAHHPQQQLVMGEAGSGMRWYPHPPPQPPPNRPRHKARRAQKATEVKAASNLILAPPDPSTSGQDAESLVAGPAGEDTELQQPMVVSSYPSVLDST
jgi:hypothetical protein